MTDPLAPIRSGAAGVVLPPQPDREHVEVAARTIRGTGRLAGETPMGLDPGMRRLLRNLRTGEAARIADRLRHG